jgi:small subunit ribosomal protein S6
MAKKKEAAATSATTTAAPSETTQYEAMFLLPPGAAMDQDGTGLRLCRSIIERHGGQVILIKKWDERKLSYEVNGQKRGTYVIAYFRGPGAIVASIERDVKLNDEILRVMVTQADHLNESEMNAVEPQPIIREERPSWERGFDDRGPRRDDRGPRGDDRRDDRGPREDRPREDRPPRARREEAPAGAAAGAGADVGANKD